MIAAWLVILNRKDMEREFELAPAGEMTLGRHASNRIALPDDQVSGKHCKFEFVDGVWHVIDLNSRNGTRVNDVTIHERRRLNDGDVIAVGTTKLRFIQGLKVPPTEMSVEPDQQSPAIEVETMPKPGRSEPANATVCPACQKQLALPATARGKVVQCSWCGEDFEVLADGRVRAAPIVAAAMSSEETPEEPPLAVVVDDDEEMPLAAEMLEEEAPMPKRAAPAESEKSPVGAREAQPKRATPLEEVPVAHEAESEEEEMPVVAEVLEEESPVPQRAAPAELAKPLELPREARPKRAVPVVEEAMVVEVEPEAEAGYPWNPPMERLAKVAAYDQAGQFASHLCTGGEFLNTLLKHETFKALRQAKGDLRVYPDLVAVDARPGCLDAFLEKMPPWLRMILGGILTFLFGLPLIAAVLVGAALVVGGLFLLVSFPFVVIPFVLILLAVVAVLDYLERQRLTRIAARIRAEPRSPYAVAKLFKYAPTIPRIWASGDAVGGVMQIVRVDTRRKLLKRAMIVVVQDNPIPAHGGCFYFGAGVFLGRCLHKRSRVFALAMDGGVTAADRAAEEMSRVLGVPVSRGKFTMNRLVLMD